jgi:EAL domain-containing protein (putative c-di-GMP-specific phosphodiesterase class I)
MAQALEPDTVAEGIETQEQAAMPRSLEYRHGQGHLFASCDPPRW